MKNKKIEVLKEDPLGIIPKDWAYKSGGELVYVVTGYYELYDLNREKNPFNLKVTTNRNIDQEYYNVLWDYLNNQGSLRELEDRFRSFRDEEETKEKELIERCTDSYWLEYYADFNCKISKDYVVPRSAYTVFTYHKNDIYNGGMDLDAYVRSGVESLYETSIKVYPKVEDIKVEVRLFKFLDREILDETRFYSMDDSLKIIRIG